MIADFVAEAAARRGEGAALAEGDRRWSWSELDAWVGELAEALRADGLEAGDVLPVLFDPTAEAVATLHAIARVGATAAPLNPRLAETERDAALQALSGIEGGGAQVILWTSGTEGRPRGVALSADNLRASARAAADRLSLGPEDLWLASLSVAHVGGYALVTRCALLGCELLAAEELSVAAISGALDRRGVTHLSLVPTQLHRLLEHRSGAAPPDTLSCVLLGGAHAPPELVRRAVGAGWPVALTYGKTETTSQVATAAPDLVRQDAETVGPPLEGVEVRCAEDGELLVRGPTVAMGYVGDGSPIADEDGWHHTGDFGRIDEQGRLRVTGRRAERIVSGGVTVDALEVERALLAHPAVVEVCVVGVPDAEWGEVVAAMIVGVEGELDLDELGAWAKERLGPARRPRLWRRTDRLPLNPNRKIDRPAVQALFVGRTGAS